MTTFLTADTHFGHATMITGGPQRPFGTVDEMNEALITSWNAVVHPKDTVWHMGDFSMKLNGRATADIFYQLNGRKHLIIGNHDVDNHGRLLPALERLDWVSVSHAAEIQHDGQRIMLSHYAGYTWNCEHRGAYQAFGHSHGTLLGMPGSVDVGVDAQDLKPISVGEFVRQAEDTIIQAEERIEQIVDRLVGRLDSFKEHADSILKKRRTAGDVSGGGVRP